MKRVDDRDRGERTVVLRGGGPSLLGRRGGGEGGESEASLGLDCVALKGERYLF